jgi:hypothetical protein
VAYQLDAVLKDANGNLLQGATLSFQYRLSSGMAFTSAGSAVTDSTGTASVTVDLQPGVYDIEALFAGTTVYSASKVDVTYDVTAPAAATSVTETVSPTAPTTSSTITVTGSLTSTSGGVSGAEVDLSLNGAAPTKLTTDSSGDYSATVKPLAAGSYTLTASFPGSDQYLPSSHQLNFVVTAPGATTTGLLGLWSFPIITAIKKRFGVS